MSTMAERIIGIDRIRIIIGRKKEWIRPLMPSARPIKIPIKAEISRASST